MRTRVSPALMAEISGALEPRERVAEFLRSAIRAELERREAEQAEEAAPAVKGFAALDALLARVSGT